MSSLPFHERTTTATRALGPVSGRRGRQGISVIGAMIIDTYAHVRRMNSEIQPTPDPPRSDDRRRDLPRACRAPRLGAADHRSLVAIGLTAASTIVLTRYLGVADYGRFTVLTVFLLIGLALSEFGLNGTAIRWFASGERPEDVFASLIGLRLVLSTAAAVTALAVFALYPRPTPRSPPSSSLRPP